MTADNALLLAAGLVLGIVVTLLFGGLRHARALARLHREHEAQRRGEQLVHEERRAALGRELEQQTVARERLAADLEAQREAATALKEERAALASRLQAHDDAHRDALERLERRLAEALEKVASGDAENRRLKSTQVELETRQAEQEKRNEERLREFDEARRRMAVEFENLANRILEEKGRTFSEQSRSGLDELLKPVREQLGDFRRKVEEVHLADTRERASLRAQLDGLKQLNREMNDEARNLTRALKGDKKTQGNWGEVVLERVLERSGLRRGEEYEVQGSFRDAERRLLRPDVVVHLPEGKDVVIDSKVSLVAWTEYVGSDDEALREAALKAHVQALRNHLGALGAKEYAELGGVRSLDFILMFVPIEAAFTAAFQADEKLFVDAFDAKIVVVTPTTLLATLRTIENLWRYERQNENARHIAEQAGRIYDKLRGFIEDFEKVGTQLATTLRTYDSARGKLTDGRGNLVRQVEQFRTLGVRVRQAIPKPVLDRAGVDPDATGDEGHEPAAVAPDGGDAD